MIGYLRGTVLQKLEKSLILVAGDVGYELLVPNDILASTNLETPVELFVHTHVREDQITLFGFSSLEERAFFLSVISVSGIGPKIGLEILSSPLDQVKRALLDKDAAFLTGIPGIGKKTAERMIIELHSKVKDLPMESFAPGAPAQSDIIEALENLGYKRDSILLALKHKPEDVTKEEDVIKYCLQVL